MEKNRRINFLIFGQLFAIFSSKLLDIAAGMALLEKVVGTNLNIGFFYAIFFIPCIFFVIPFSDLSVFISRKRLIVFGDLFLFALMIGALFIEQDGYLVLINALVLLTVHRIAVTSYRLALDFTIAEWSEDFRDLKKSNICYSISITLAPVIGAVIYFLFDAFVLFALSAILFLIAIILSLFLNNGLSEKLLFRNFDPFKMEGIKNYIKYDSNKKLLQLLKLDFILNMFFAPVFMCIIPLTINTIGLRVTTLSASIAIFILGVILAVYINTSSKRKTLSLNIVVIVLFTATFLVAIVAGFAYYLFISQTVFEVLFFLLISIAGACFTMANVYSYIEYRKLVNKKMEKDFFTFHLLGLVVAVGFGNLIMGVFLSFFRISISIILICLIAALFLQSLGEIDVDR